MAVVIDQYIQSTDGIKKTIDKGSMGMALDILQRGLYAHPIQSTVRELASNGYDAIKEREVAKGILLGTTSIEEHFDVTKVDGVFHSSGWDPSYFDLNWLSDDSNVYIYYEEGNQKDTLRIVDHGVGLGKTRLVNYFMLNWSSKRSNRDSLGRFGLGSKVALSLGIDSFRVITKYNGRKFKFDVFLDKIESVISKFSSKGVANEPFILIEERQILEDDGTVTTVPAYVAYCEPTEDKNGVELQIEVKKHNKDLFFEAVDSQLMYMPNIKFQYRKLRDTLYTDIDVAAKILYRDANVIISESTVYDKPHILLGTGEALLCYGILAFNELEIEPKRGSVGLIMDINDIEVTPSREMPIWSAKTRAAVLAKYKQVSEKASEYLNQELSSEKDYLTWIAKAAQIIGSIRQGGSNNSVLSRLASIIDFEDIGSVCFPGSKIIFSPKPKDMFGESLTVRTVAYVSDVKKVERKSLVDLCLLSKPLYFTKFGSNPFKDRYIFEEFGQFVLVNVKEGAVIDDKGKQVLSSSCLQDYDNLKIPDDRMELYLADVAGLNEDEDATEAKQAEKVDYSALRRENKQIVLHMLSGGGGTYDYKFSATDVNISDIPSKFTDQIVLYTTGGDRETMSNILAMFPQAMLSCVSQHRIKNMHEWGVTIPLPEVTTRIGGVLLAQENVKYVKSSSKYLSIPDFIVKNYNSKSGFVVFNDLIKFAATHSVIGSLFKERFEDIWSYFTYNAVKELDEGLYSISNFYYKYYNKYDEQPLRNIYITDEFFRSVITYQLYKSGIIEASEETIEEYKDLINKSVPDYLCDVIDNIEDVDILDIELIKAALDLFEYYSKGKELVQLFAQYSSYSKSLPQIAAELREYLQYLNATKP